MACLPACLDDAGLQEYLEATEPSPLRRMVEARLTSCARCRATFDRVMSTHRRVNTWLGRLTVSSASPTFAFLNDKRASCEAPRP
jgi:hypothetical protein